MKNRQEVPKPLALSIIALIVICLLIAIFAPVASAQSIKPKKGEMASAYHFRLQKQNSWETYQANRLKSAKAVKKAKGEQLKAVKLDERLRAKIRRIEEK
jgi:predicted Holliday junction resolvase-like endonuclease